MKHSIHSLTLTQGPRKKRLYPSTLSLCLYAFALTLMTVSRQPSHYSLYHRCFFLWISWVDLSRENIRLFFVWLYKWSGMLPLSKSSQPENSCLDSTKLPSRISNIQRKTPGGQTTLTTQPSGASMLSIWINDEKLINANLISWEPSYTVHCNKKTLEIICVMSERKYIAGNNNNNWFDRIDF